MQEVGFAADAASLSNQDRCLTVACLASLIFAITVVIKIDCRQSLIHATLIGWKEPMAKSEDIQATGVMSAAVVEIRGYHTHAFHANMIFVKAVTTMRKFDSFNLTILKQILY
jgi:hypothetical protein